MLGLKGGAMVLQGCTLGQPQTPSTGAIHWKPLQQSGRLATKDETERSTDTTKRIKMKTMQKTFLRNLRWYPFRHVFLANFRTSEGEKPIAVQPPLKQLESLSLCAAGTKAGWLLAGPHPSGVPSS